MTGEHEVSGAGALTEAEFIQRALEEAAEDEATERRRRRLEQLHRDLRDARYVGLGILLAFAGLMLFAALTWPDPAPHPASAEAAAERPLNP